MDPIAVTISATGLVFLLYETYFAWFKPQKHLEHYGKRKAWLTKRITFIPDWLIGFPVFPEHPKALIWLTRFGTLLMDMLFLLGLITAISGPY